jgi:hypothetical protein
MHEPKSSAATITVVSSLVRRVGMCVGHRKRRADDLHASSHTIASPRATTSRRNDARDRDPPRSITRPMRRIMQSSDGKVLATRTRMPSRSSFVALASLLVVACSDASVVHLDVAPPPIGGSALAVLADGHTALVADADRDRVMVVDLGSRAVTRTIALAPHAEPGRMVQDAHGVAHVVLRGPGDVLSFDPHAATDATTVHVCDAPRGIDYDASHDEVVVACRSGELVTLDAAGQVTSRASIEPDLRDVIVAGTRRFVTTFRRAELLEIDRDGRVLSRQSPAGVAILGNELEAYSASVAWRAVYVSARGTIAMVHQRGRTSSIAVHTPPAVRQPTTSAYGVPVGTRANPVTCPSGVVHAAVTFFDLDGTVHSGGAIPGAVLPVDLAVNGDQVSVVAAGAADGAASVFTSSPAGFGAGSDGCASASGVPSARQPVAVAFDGTGTPLVLDRATASLSIGDARVALGGASVIDTGHDLFHRDAGASVACASCHPEGGDDGRLWVFDGVGRRTQALGGGLSATAPFHWDGNDATFDDVIADVLVHRMHGTAPTPEASRAFMQWIDAIPSPRVAVADTDAVTRGAAVFAGAGGCTECHSGAHFTNNETVDVGTGGPLQVPSLLGVSQRLPVMHDGCAATLDQRFDTNCGGDRHGHVDALDAQQRSDLVAYLSSL